MSNLDLLASRPDTKPLDRLHNWIERKTGIVFGRYTTTGYTTFGFPLEHVWLAVTPRRDGYAFCVSVKRHGFYLDYVPRHEEA